MPRITFRKNFDWHVKPNVTIAYLAGKTYLVSQAISEAAVAAGCAEGEKAEHPRPRRTIAADDSR